MKFSIIIPAHNEEDCIVETVQRLLKALHRERIPHEVIVVDDGSTDSTVARIAPLAGSESLVLVKIGRASCRERV